MSPTAKLTAEKHRRRAAVVLGRASRLARCRALPGRLGGLPCLGLAFRASSLLIFLSSSSRLHSSFLQDMLVGYLNK
jgi:hypothetical protein